MSSKSDTPSGHKPSENLGYMMIRRQSTSAIHEDCVIAAFSYLFVYGSGDSYGLAFLNQCGFSDFFIGAEGNGVPPRTQTLSFAFRGVGQCESTEVANCRCPATVSVFALTNASTLGESK
jgi:hypothetical protein